MKYKDCTCSGCSVTKRVYEFDFETSWMTFASLWFCSIQCLVRWTLDNRKAAREALTK